MEPDTSPTTATDTNASTNTSRSRRRFLRTLGGATAATALGSTAGCLRILFGPSGGGTVPGGTIPTMQTVTRDDGDIVVEDAAALVDQLSHQDGRVIWIPVDARIDMTGRDATIRNTIVASGRNEGQRGGQIFSDSMGSDSVNYWGGNNGNGCLDIEQGGRLSGLRIRGPTYDYFDSPAVPGWIPFAPQDSRSAREEWRGERHSRCLTLLHDSAQVDNCEIWGWSTQAIAVGTRGSHPQPTISHCAIHNNCMTSFGYGVDVRGGNPLVYRCWFDANRHHLNGHGHANCGYRALECTLAPHATSHLIDMHAVQENESGSSDRSDPFWRHRAGGYMLVKKCKIQATHNIEHPRKNHASGRPTSHVKIRGVPADGFHFESNWCAHETPPDNDAYSYANPINQSHIPGSVSTDENGYANIYASANQFGVSFDVPAWHQPPESPYSPP